MGDFNAITSTREMKGIGNFSGSQEVVEFKNWVNCLELVDPPLLGRKFTWFRADCTTMSRLDIFILSKEWIQTWEVVAQWALNRDVSDHCPIVLRNGSQNWGPKPFRFNNCWLEHQGFKNMVERLWKEFRVEGWYAYVSKEKLRQLKANLKT